MEKCPFFFFFFGCKYDFASADYRANKLAALHGFAQTDAPRWIAPGGRRRADFCFAGGDFGLFETRTKNIVPVRTCPNLVAQINDVLPLLAKLPWVGAGSCLITACDNGIDVTITSGVPYFTSEFKSAIEKLPIIRATWNGKVIFEIAAPVISFDDVTVPYPAGAFLQPGRAGESELRQLVVSRAVGAHRVADLFCGLGNFTFALNADGFDIVGTGTRRDLFKNPLTLGMLKQYDCVVMDPPRAGAMAQCRILAKSDVARIIYVSCNPESFRRDAEILTRGGYRMSELIGVDQFVGSAHWELFAVFVR